MTQIKPRSKESKFKPHPEAKGLLFIGITLILSLCVVSFVEGNRSANWLGLIGYSIAFAMQYLFGLGTFLILAFLGWIGWKHLSSEKETNFGIKTLYFSIFLISCCILFNLYADTKGVTNPLIQARLFSEKLILRHPFPHRYIRYHLGGAPLYYLYRDLSTFSLEEMLSNVGIFLTFSMTSIVSLILLTEVRTLTVLKKTGTFLSSFSKGFVRLFHFFKPMAYDNSSKDFSYSSIEKSLQAPMKPMPRLPEPVHETVSICEPAPPQNHQNPPRIKYYKDRNETSGKQKQHHKSGNRNYRLPPPHLLTVAKKVDQPTLKKDLQRQAKILEDTLMSFGVEAKVGQINCGPTITSFEVHPPVGVKVQKIKVLENDIALNLQAKSIRIIAPIPGKAAVGIEIPSLLPQEVGFKEMLTSYHRQQHRFHIPMLLGKTVSGDDVRVDLTKMPHCIIAGATGSGKSVCINTIVLSIVMNCSPDDVKLILIDPKKVELSGYTNLPHMAAPVITEAHGAYAALNWLVKEMEYRYEVLKQLGYRNIKAFNHRKIKPKIEEALEIPIPEKMPFIVAIIDEFADLMMASSSDLETPIARIAQMARAVGIHLILATQRPSREVITGLIKANFPTRIAFKVASRVNSQIILDENGAETLLGNGDLLFLPPGSSQLLRAQGVFIRDEDINRVVDYICQQQGTEYLIKSFDKLGQESLSLKNDEARDDLYHQALTIVVKTGNASTTYLQRKLKIGYARAASLMDELESRGIIGPQEGSRARQVLVKNSEFSKES